MFKNLGCLLFHYQSSADTVAHWLDAVIVIKYQAILNCLLDHHLLLHAAVFYVHLIFG